jgi:hypothetical protein
VPFLVDDLQGTVDILELRCQYGKVSAYIRSYFLSTMNAFVFFDVGGNFLGNGVMMPEDVAKNSFHNVGFRYALVDLGLPMVVLNFEFFR